MKSQTIPFVPSNYPDVQLDQHQQGVVDEICERVDSGVRVTTLGGLGGTGKSVLVAALAAQFPGFAVLAPTNKAVKVLHAKGIERAQTIHSLIKQPKEDLPTEAEAQEIARKLACNPPEALTKQEQRWCTPEFGTKNNGGFRGIICDEASMVDKQLFMDMMAQEVPLIFTGDYGQLPPVSKDPDDPAFSLMRHPDLVLTKVYRNAGDIARFAAHLREGGRPEHFKPTDGSVTIGKASSLGLPVDAQILAWKNDTVLTINMNMRKGLGFSGIVQAGDRVVFDYTYTTKGEKRGDTWVAGGDKFSKGTLATVLDVKIIPDSPNPLITLEVEDGREVTLQADANFFTKAKASPQPRSISRPIQLANGRISYATVENPAFAVPIRHAYGLTVHKSQGSEWPKVAVIQDMPSRHDDFKAWAYTAASRAKGHLTWLFNC